MPKQYHFWPSSDGVGFDAWDVEHLIRRAADRPVIEVSVASITEIDTAYWSGDESAPTVRWVVEHARAIRDADLRWPVLLSVQGRVMDGMHRIARAVLDGTPTVRAVRFTEPIEPDHRNCHPRDLDRPGPP